MKNTDDNVLTKEQFSELVEQFAIDNKIELIPAIMEICLTHDIDYEAIPKIITADLKEKIAFSADVHDSVYGKINELF